MKVVTLSLFAILLLPTIACGGEGNGGPTATPVVEPSVTQAAAEGQANLFRNPGFESGGDPWYVVYLPMFEVSRGQSHSGQSSALLKMQEPPEATGTKVHYLVQDVTSQEFPELISGYYRVDKWIRGTRAQYLQFVVSVHGAFNLPGGYSTHQLRYPLAGISEDPFVVYNTFFIFLSREDPPIGEWVYFERNIKQDYQDFWGAAPEGFSRLTVFFEVRYDGKEAGAPAEADVYYDDLYMGPASENPNRPL